MAPKRKEQVVAPQKAKKVKKDAAAAKLSQQIDQITDALDAAPVTDEVKAMLVEVLPHSLGEYSDKRHRYQLEVIENVAEMMKQVEADLNKKVEELRAKHTEALSCKPTLEKEQTTSGAELEAAKAETQRLKVALAEVAMAFRGAQQALADAEAAKKVDAQKSVEANKKKGHFGTALEDLRILKAISPDDNEAEVRQKELVSLLKKYKFEESMLIALPAALAKAPDVRGQFDLMAIGQLETEISKMVAEQESILAAAKPDQDKCEAAVRKAQEALTDARAKQRAAAKKYDEASKHQAECEEKCTKGQKALRDATKTADKLAKSVYESEAQVELFQQGPKETFKELCERTTPAPVVEEEPQAEEAVAMEQEAEAPAVAAN